MIWCAVRPGHNLIRSSIINSLLCEEQCSVPFVRQWRIRWNAKQTANMPTSLKMKSTCRRKIKLSRTSFVQRDEFSWVWCGWRRYVYTSCRLSLRALAFNSMDDGGLLDVKRRQQTISWLNRKTMYPAIHWYDIWWWQGNPKCVSFGVLCRWVRASGWGNESVALKYVYYNLQIWLIKEMFFFSYEDCIKTV